MNLGRILASLLVIGVVGGAGVAASSAFFSDTAVSQNNSFSAGNFMINILETDGDVNMPFDVEGLMPGDEVVAYVTVVNAGDADMKWRAYISGGNGGQLFGALRVKNVVLRPSDFNGYTELTDAGYTIAGPSDYTIPSINDLPFSSLVDQDNGYLVWDSPAEPFAPMWAATYKITVEMDPNAGNEYIGTNWMGDMTFYATQWDNPSW